MAKIRCIVVDVEGSDAAVLAAMEHVMRASFGVVREPVALPVAPIATTALAAPAIPEPMRAPKAKAAAKHSTAHSEPGKGSMSDAVRVALRKAPMSNGDLERHLKSLGFDTDSKRLTVLLCGLRAKGECFKGDDDYLWHMATPAKELR